MAIGKEIRDFWSFFWKTPKSEKTIVFYAEHQDYYPYFEGLIKKLITKHQRSLCYITSDWQDPILKRKEPGIKAFYLNKLLPFLMVFLNCKVFIMTLTDLNQFYLKRSFNPVHYVYIFHSLVSTHLIYRRGAFDHYDSILCCGPHQVQEIRRYEQQNGLRPKRLVEAGYYRLERICAAYQEYSSKQLAAGSGGKRRILIAPSWGKGNILEICGKELVQLLLGEGYRVIVRPHPQTFRHSPELVSGLAAKFINNEDFRLERSVATDDSLLQAELLISDYSGIALEYALGTERPVLFLDVPVKMRNPRYKELGLVPLELSLRSKIGVVVSPKRLSTLPRAISDLIADRESYQRHLTELRRQYLYAWKQSSEISAGYIIKLCDAPIPAGNISRAVSLFL